MIWGMPAFRMSGLGEHFSRGSRTPLHYFPVLSLFSFIVKVFEEHRDRSQAVNPRSYQATTAARYYVITLNTASKLIHRTFERNAIEPHTETTQLLQQLHTIWKLKTKQFAIHTPLTPIKQQLIYRTMPNRAGLPFARPLVHTNINLYCSGLASTITMIHQTLDLSLTNSLKQLLT